MNTVSASKLGRALHKALAVDEFAISEVQTHAATRTIGGENMYQEAQAHKVLATLYVDRKRGRGEALLAPRADLPLQKQVKEASTRAFGALGKAWRLPAPAAAAQVAVRDSNMQGTPGEAAELLMDVFRSKCPTGLRILRAQLRVQYGTHRALVSNGFDNRFRSTEIALGAMVQADKGIPVPIYLRARRASDLKLSEAIDGALRRSVDHAQAQPATPGTFDVVLLASSYVPRNQGDFGVWTPLVAQASASLVRDGLSTHVPGQAILSLSGNDESRVGDLLTIKSIGTIPFGLRSAPFSSDGEATRNFALAENGKAAGFSIHHRDSALGAGPPNGGVRGLMVSSGSRSVQELQRPATRPLLIAHHIGPMQFSGQGRVYMEIESATLVHRDAVGVVQKTPIRSAVLCGSLYDWLANAYYSRETSDESWFQGPEAIRLDGVQIHG